MSTDPAVNGGVQAGLEDPSVTEHELVLLTGLNPAAFAHPYDRSAIEALKKLKGVDWIIAKYLEYYERGAHVELNASGVRVTNRQLPRIHSLLVEACRVLDMPVPELYVKTGPRNAFTSGHNNPYIVLCTELIDVMSDPELQAVIAHELGHVKCGHVVYKEIVKIITFVGVSSGKSDGFKATVQLAMPFIRRALLEWDQRSELSADRAAMLVAQDEGVCIRMLLKLAGAPARLAAELDVNAFLDQARHLQDLTFDSKVASDHRRRMLDNSSHPLTVERARQLDSWITEGGYDAVRRSPRGTNEQGEARAQIDMNMIPTRNPVAASATRATDRLKRLKRGGKRLTQSPTDEMNEPS